MQATQHIIKRISLWSASRWSWALLFAISLLLEIAALVFQHGFGFEPCVMCIYQRTAMWGVVLASALVLIINNGITRLLAYAGWLVSSIWGAIIAWEHIDILTAANPFFASCAPVPNFPDVMPLHQWMPKIFAAPGSCTDNSWQFLGFGMPQWMFVIFIISSVLATAFITIRFIKAGKP